MSPQLRHHPDLPRGSDHCCLTCRVRRKSIVIIYIALIVTILLVLALRDL